MRGWRTGTGSRASLGAHRARLVAGSAATSGGGYPASAASTGVPAMVPSADRRANRANNSSEYQSSSAVWAITFWWGARRWANSDRALPLAQVEKVPCRPTGGLADAHREGQAAAGAHVEHHRRYRGPEGPPHPWLIRPRVIAATGPSQRVGTELPNGSCPAHSPRLLSGRMIQAADSSAIRSQSRATRESANRCGPSTSSQQSSTPQWWASASLGVKVRPVPVPRSFAS